MAWARPIRTCPRSCVLISEQAVDQPLYSRLWGNGFLAIAAPGRAVPRRGGAGAYLDNPAGHLRRRAAARCSTGCASCTRLEYETVLDPAIKARIAQYEMAFRMQTRVPEVTDSRTSPSTSSICMVPDARKPGTFAANCLLARRLAERDVRFIQLYHPGWDHHGDLPGGIRVSAARPIRPCAALIQDLKQRGMLDDTLVVWGGEFGRTNYCQGKLTATDYGRDHHPRCFTVWMAGGGIKPGISLRRDR